MCLLPSLWEDNPFVHDGKKLSAYSVHGYVRTIKAFWSWLMDEGYISHNPMSTLKLPKTPKKVISTFSPEQIQKVLNAIDQKNSHGFRNYTIILLLLDSGGQYLDGCGDRSRGRLVSGNRPRNGHNNPDDE